MLIHDVARSNRRRFLMLASALGIGLGFSFCRDSKGRPFMLSATVDFPDDVGFGLYNEELLDEMISQIKSMGVKRIYWLYYGDVDPQSYWAGTMFGYMKYGSKMLEQIGEPVKAVTPIAHRHGLEIYGVLKPFNTGMAGTYPEGSPEAATTTISRIGGNLQQAIPFIEQHPHTRVRRRPSDLPPNLASIPIKKIRLIKHDDSPTRIKREHLQIWTSPNNHAYVQKRVPFRLTESVETSDREVRDYYGSLITAKGAAVRTLTLEGLNLEDQFILVTTDFEDEEGDFRNTAMAMVEAYGPGPDPLPIVVATRSAIWIRPRDFRESGLEFDSGLGPYQVDLDVNNASTEGTMFGIVKKSKWNWGGCIAFARGKNDHLACTPCEVYPEVQKLWMGWIDRLIDAGVDGVDLRISAHGSLADEAYEYGFNEPIVEEYQDRFGADLLGDGYDLGRLSQLRGEHYTAFVRKASERVRGAKRKFQVHVHTEAFRPDPCHGQLMGFPANLHFDWKAWLKQGLVDGITLRTSWFEAPEADRGLLGNTLSDPVVEEALGLTSELGIPVYLNRYLKRANSIEEYASDLGSIFQDERFAGFDVYEFAHVSRPTPDASKLEPVENRLERIRAKAEELGIR